VGDAKEIPRMQTTTSHEVASAVCAELAPLLGTDPIPVGVAAEETGGIHVAVVAVLVRIRDVARVRTATGLAEDREGAIRAAVLEALGEHALLEQALERLVEEGALEAAIVRWGDRPLTFAGDADVDLRLIALFDLTLAGILLPGGRLALCTDRYAYRLLGGRPAVALAAKPGGPALELDRIAGLIEDLLARTPADAGAGDLADPATVASDVAGSLGEDVRWLRLEHGDRLAATGPHDPCGDPPPV
jgi:hypothetical protein